MKLYGFLTILLFLFLTACNDGARSRGDGADLSSGAGGLSDAVQAENRGGMQVVEIEAGSMGFEPDRIALKSGLPTRLIFTRTAEAACIESVSIPAFGIEKTPLPLHEEKVIEFEPGESGEFTFVCGMEMQEGALIVSAS